MLNVFFSISEKKLEGEERGKVEILKSDFFSFYRKSGKQVTENEVNTNVLNGYGNIRICHAIEEGLGWRGGGGVNHLPSRRNSTRNWFFQKEN